MIAFIDDHRERAMGSSRSARFCRSPRRPIRRMRRRGAIREGLAAGAARRGFAREIRRVFDDNFQVYGVRKVWRQLQREAIACRVAGRAADAADGLARRRAWQAGQNDGERQGGALPARPGQPAVPGAAPECAVGVGLHLCRHLGGLCLRRLRHRRLRAPDRRLARLALGAYGLRARRAGAGACANAVPVRSGLVHHSDRGVQYVSIQYTERLADAGIDLRSAASATATTTRSPRPSTACTKPK